MDWQAVRGRLQANEQVLEQALNPTPQRIEDAYRMRAAKLAQVETRNTSASAAVSALVFRLGQERYAIEMKYLAEVLPFGTFAPVPRSTAAFLGVISVRGEVRAVVDLRRVLAPLSEKTDISGFVLLLRATAGSEQIGFRVDSVEELREMRSEELTRTAPGTFVIGYATDSLPLLGAEAVLEHVFSTTKSDGSNAEPNGGSSIK